MPQLSNVAKTSVNHIHISRTNDYASVEIALSYLKNKEFIYSYTDMIGSRRVDIYKKNERSLTASVYKLSHNIATKLLASDLPVYGIPEALDVTDNNKIRKFFMYTYFMPEKSCDSEYNRVVAHAKVIGGMKSQIPHQPGLALGSVISSKVLEEMNTYADNIAISEAMEEEMQTIEQRIETLEAKILAKKTRDCYKKLVESWENEQKALLKKLENIADTMAANAGHDKEEERTPDKPIVIEPKKYCSSLQSPVDSALSKIEVQVRGFDSLHYSSQYFRTSEQESIDQDQIKQVSGSGAISGEGGFLLFNAKASLELEGAISSRINRAKKSKAAKGLLVINASSTSRYVRCYTDLKFDKDRTKSIVESMKTIDSKEKLSELGISVRDGRKQIYILTEAVLGGSFQAYVTFLDEEETAREIENKAKEGKVGASAQGGFSGPLGGGPAKIGGNVGLSLHGNKEDKQDKLTGNTNTSINIEFVCNGVVAQFNRRDLEHEIIEHMDLNPSNYYPNEQELNSLSTDLTSSPSDFAANASQRGMAMENAQAAVLNTIQALTSSKSTQSVHDITSVMEAFDDFVSKISSDPNSGMPIGYGYQVFTQEQLEEKLRELENVSTAGMKHKNENTSFEKRERSEDIQTGSELLETGSPSLLFADQ